jgi:hypothetical protein
MGRNLYMNVVCSKDKGSLFLLEPWGLQFDLIGGDVITIEAERPTTGFPEIVFSDDKVIYYGWSGSIVKLSKNGEQITPSDYQTMPVPRIP